MAPRYVCIHGHFYQPPRENPWLEAVEEQDSAAPFHDWNERVTRECYGPNSRSRLTDGSGKIIGLSNNYTRMSFNFGPTLLAWMAEEAPDVLRGIIEGDRLSRERRRGHGNAIAQVYNHVIMPLASARDKRTEVLWGVADFRRRFGRDPEGMWLAETAADANSLEALAEAGIHFTILAPRQAKRWRKIGEQGWSEGPREIDPSRAYECRLPSGRSIALFFYDGCIAQKVAFEHLLDNGDRFLNSLLQGFDGARTHPQLVHIATDGESYGHHHRFGDMALAYVLDRLSKDSEVRLTNYGEYLELHPPEWEVEIHDNSSWSCAHGVERWRSNCGCCCGGGCHQQWRGPMRQALDQLKTKLDELFVARGREIFPDPWAARDHYIQVILDRGETSVRRFMHEHGHPEPDPKLPKHALWLLELQRHALLMYTSCGWFFDEISGLEATQCLRYAARAIQLARHFKEELGDEFVAALARAPSNLPQFRDGRGVWEQLIHPWQVDLDRVVAHYAIRSLYREPEPVSQVYCFDLETLDFAIQSRGESGAAIGRLRVRLRTTCNEAEIAFVVIHFGGLDFHAVLREKCPVPEYEAFKQQLLKTLAEGSFADVTELVRRDFPGNTRRLDDLFEEEQRRIINTVLRHEFESYQQSFDRLFDQSQATLNTLARLRYPIPESLKAATSATLNRRLEAEVRQLAARGDSNVVKRLAEQGRSWGFWSADANRLQHHLEKQLDSVVGEASQAAELAALLPRTNAVLDAASVLGVRLDLWQAQNQLLEAYARMADSIRENPARQEAFMQLADRLDISRGLLGWRP
jgi:alpha-amylase/alpha-mannosidase (GH57 family)